MRRATLWVLGCALPALTLGLALGTIPAHASDYYVDQAAGLDDPTAGTTAIPWKTIDYAFDVISGSVVQPHTIHVAQGTYSENVVMDPYESLVGGYHTGTWDWDPRAYATAITPALAGDVVAMADGCSLVGFTVEGGSARGVSARDATVSIEDCVIQDNQGGGVYGEGCQMSFSDCVFQSNTTSGNAWRGALR